MNRAHSPDLLLADVSYVGEQVEPEVRPVGQIQRFQMRGKFTQFCEIPNILFGKDVLRSRLEASPSLKRFSAAGGIAIPGDAFSAAGMQRTPKPPQRYTFSNAENMELKIFF